MGTNTGTIMTLANSIIGVSVLAMPFCFKQCGIALSILMLIASSLLSRLACHFLLKSAVMARRRTFEFLAFHTFGSTGKFTVELFIIGFLMGTCIAFFVVMGDLGPAIVAKILGLSNTTALRPSVLIGLAIFVVLPLGMLRNVDSLSSVSMATIGFYICLVLKVVGESLPHLLAGDWYEHVYFWRPAGILQCIPIFSMALFCQTQLFEIYETMHNASLDRMNFVIRAACNICTGVYICVGFFGYIAFCTQPFTGNVLMSFTPSIVSEMIKLGFVLSVAVSFPLVIFPCRASLYSLLFRRITMPHHEGVGSHIPEARFKCLTAFIISVALVIGLLIPNIELVLGLVGSTIGVLICVMFPAAAFICMSTKSSRDRMLAQVLLFIGALILVLGTYATLHSANETKSAPNLHINDLASANDEKMPHFHEKIDNSLVDIPPKLEQKLESDVKPIVGEQNKKSAIAADINVAPVQSKEVKVDVNKADKRQEPPVPVEPVGNVPPAPVEPIGNIQPSAIPIIKEEKTDSKASVKEVEKIQIQNGVEEKKTAKSESENKELKPVVGEQVHQDAIKKEDEELAEAEKRGEAPGENKNEEILRKLEKHEAQQMKILEEQKQILQALQEHQERELLKEKQDNIEKNVIENKHGEENIIQNDNADSMGEKKVDTLIKQTKENVVELPISLTKAKKTAETIIMTDEKEIIPGKKKQDLLQQIANGELRKHIALAPSKEKVRSEKFSKPSETPIKIPVPGSSTFGKDVPELAEIKESLNVAAPNINPKPELGPVPAQPLLLERLNSPPLPLIMHNKNKSFISPPKVINEIQPQEPAKEINAMRREILQEPAASTKVPLVEDVLKIESPVKKDTLNNTIGVKQVHDREKREVEDTDKTNAVAEFGDAKENIAYGNVNIEGNIPLDEQNCHIAETTVDDNFKRSNEMYKKHNTIAKAESVSQGNVKHLETTVSNMLPPSESSDIKSEHNVKPENLVLNSSKDNANKLSTRESALDKTNHLTELKSALQDSDIEPTMIKSATYLSNPQIKSNDDEVAILRQRNVSPDAKPMKRDLKSISVPEEKSRTPQKQG